MDPGRCGSDDSRMAVSAPRTCELFAHACQHGAQQARIHITCTGGRPPMGSSLLCIHRAVGACNEVGAALEDDRRSRDGSGEADCTDRSILDIGAGQALPAG